MKKILLTLLSLTFFAFSNGQESHDKIRITTTPFQFIFLDFPVSIEKQFKQHTIGLTFSYRPDIKNSGEVKGMMGLYGDYKMQNFWNNLYEAVTFGINSKYYFPKMQNYYFDIRLFYRHWWFDNKYASYDNIEGYRFEGMRTERQNVFGMKLLFGKTIVINTKAKIHPLIDIYGGIGFRYKTYSFITQNGTVYDIYHDYLIEEDRYWSKIPSLHFGVRVGIGVK